MTHLTATFQGHEKELEHTARSRPLASRMRAGGILLVAMLVGMTLARLLFWSSFRTTDSPLSSLELAQAVWVGSRFDLRLGLLLLTPMFLLWQVPRFDPSRSAAARRFWTRYLALLCVCVALLYAFDFGHYDYLETHLDASALRFLGSVAISFRMLWESYPLGWGVLGLLALGLGTHYVLGRLFEHTLAAPERAPRKPALAVAVVAACLFGIYGKVSYYPLRWSDAFRSPNRFGSDLALNPVLYFVDTLNTAERDAYDRAELEARYDRVADYLGVKEKDEASLSFRRRVEPTPLLSGRPNVVVVLMESLAAHKTGILGNALQPTPNFDRLAREGLLWRRFYTPQIGTARGVFASVTGIPDTILKRNASRNPRTVDQYVLPAAFEGYEKHYFLGGSATWANIRGCSRTTSRIWSCTRRGATTGIPGSTSGGSATCTCSSSRTGCCATRRSLSSPTSTSRATTGRTRSRRTIEASSSPP